MFRSVPMIGWRGEWVARRYLKRRSYRILAANLRSRMGEIDILCEAPDGRTLVVVEVKTRWISATGGRGQGLLPEIRVGAEKQKKLSVLAALLLRRERWKNRPVRFDVIGVDLRPWRRAVVRHHVGAFQSYL